MTPISIAVSSLIVALSACGALGLSITWAAAEARAKRAAQRDLDRANNQLDTYRIWLGDPARLHAAHADVPRPDKDELR